MEHKSPHECEQNISYRQGHSRQMGSFYAMHGGIKYFALWQDSLNPRVLNGPYLTYNAKKIIVFVSGQKVY